MSKLATTKLSSKGQVVIPEEIRDQMGLHSGDQFLVVAEKDVVILKVISRPSMDEYRELIAKTRVAAKKADLTKGSVASAVEVVRKTR